ncbi:5-carboxymethyl-2-hydroxymuconate isomerase [Apiospora phragmitis]|uniref:5-carboxymethyl-2-hydroxymuconate isomerase n=1 Tax=Apiospora phragmitis TaxID=2905665 RepID=A0ABR1WS55_9PEZI
MPGDLTWQCSDAISTTLHIDDDEVHYGEPKITTASELESLLEKGELLATEVLGSNPFEGDATGKELKVKSLLGPLTPRDVPIVRCIGLNYIKHSKSTGYSICQEGLLKESAKLITMLLFSTRRRPETTAIPVRLYQAVCIHSRLRRRYSHTQGGGAGRRPGGLRGELCTVIGQASKEIPKEQALDHIAGYAAGNDVSSRRWQRDPAYAGGVPQWCFSKGFYKWCPMGPMCWFLPRSWASADKLAQRTWVNGELRQDSDTSDLLFGVKEIVAFVSQGTTLERGTVILTGTPAGVAMGMKEPKYLEDRDVVEVEIEELGKLRNKMTFQA